MIEHRDDLQGVLDAYLAEVGEPSVAALEAWCRRYPHYSRELTDFTVAWSVSEVVPTRPEVEALFEEALITRGLARFQDVLAGLSTPAEPVGIDSLSAEGTARGLSIQDLADRAGLSLVLLRMLDRRLIRAASVPGEAIETLARAIGREAAVVAQYLQGPPILAPGARYYADQAPAVGEQEDFFAAVRDDPDLSDEVRARWLSLEPPGA